MAAMGSAAAIVRRVRQLARSDRATDQPPDRRVHRLLMPLEPALVAGDRLVGQVPARHRQRTVPACALPGTMARSTRPLGS